MHGRALALVFVASAVLVGCDEDKKASPAAASASSAPPTSSASATASAEVAVASASAPRPPPDAVAAQHVLVAYKGAKGAPKAITRSKADAKKRAEEVAAKARSGSDFAGLAAEYSDDPGSKDRQGSVGKFTREKMTKPFSDAAFALGEGEISGVVETEFGFHVIKRNQ